MLSINKICLILFIGEINGSFLEVGNYPEYVVSGLNLPECGLGYIPKVHNILFDKNCFQNGYENITLVENLLELVKEMKSIERIGQVYTRIFQGRDALIGEAPWTVYIELERTIEMGPRLKHQTAHCTGALLTFEWVITAAHCVERFKNMDLNFPWTGPISAGSNSKKGLQTININIRKVFLHPYYEEPWLLTNNISDYNKTKLSFDLGLVKLEHKFEFQLNDSKHYLINTVCLPKVSAMNTDFEVTSFTGFGKIDENTEVDELKAADFRLMPYQQCLDIYNSDPLSLCAKTEVNDAKICTGDSGGPLVQYSNESPPRALLVGVLSGATNSSCHRTPALQYFIPTFLQQTIDWILNSIKNN